MTETLNERLTVLRSEEELRDNRFVVSEAVHKDEIIDSPGVSVLNQNAEQFMITPRIQRCM